MEYENFIKNLRKKLERLNINTNKLNTLIEQIAELYNDENYRRIFEHKGFLDAFDIIALNLDSTYDNPIPEIGINKNGKGISISVHYEPTKFWPNNHSVVETYQSGMYNEFSIDNNGNLVVRHVDETVKNSNRSEMTNERKPYDSYSQINSIQSVYDVDGNEMLRHITSYTTPPHTYRKFDLDPRARLMFIPRNFQFIPNSNDIYAQTGEILYRKKDSLGSLEKIQYNTEQGRVQITERGVFAADTQRKTLDGNYWEVFCIEDKKKTERTQKFTTDQNDYRGCMDLYGNVDIYKLQNIISDKQLKAVTSVYKEEAIKR